jgi:hypothetical protein
MSAPYGGHVCFTTRSQARPARILSRRRDTRLVRSSRVRADSALTRERGVKVMDAHVDHR